MPPPMNIETFKENLESFGADLARWPESIRESAQKLVSRSAEARQLQQEMSKVDRLFKVDKTSAPPRDLVDRIVKKTEDRE